ncbi:Uncharacterized protein YjbI, contains pentapeptide repeats [Limimonas halophila]|uniref:Uncharacterized protein YjbI, contains pentapeptide repeats n=1 Tax=Limimonas halophila TaxID=1082479 RepID=A0A1G7QXI2_9PROT|nr:pentapeptide repeat-containing protein [Limimonas halophila]SDG03154.1 Uncharacterized protein YjbI, contains pentapeptide repeats [Limimonas halophila]
MPENSLYQLYECTLTCASPRQLRNIFLIVAGAIGLGFAYKRLKVANIQSEAAAEQAQTSTRNDLINQFTSAAELIKQEDSASRLAGYALMQRVAIDSERDLHEVHRVLRVQMRELANHRMDKPDTEQTKLDTEIQSIADFLFLRKAPTSDALFPRSTRLLLLDLMPEVDLRYITLQNLNLSKATFSNVRFEQTTLFRSSFRESYFQNCRIDDVYIEQCDFTFTHIGPLTNLSNTRILKSYFHKSHQWSSSYSNCYFEDCDFSRMMLEHNVDFDRCLFTGGNQMNPCFDNALFMDCKFRDWDTIGATFNYAEIDRTIFLDINFDAARMQNCNFHKTGIQRSSFRGASFRESKFYKSEFYYSNLSDSEFEECHGDRNIFRECKLDGIDDIDQDRMGIRLSS